MGVGDVRSGGGGGGKWCLEEEGKDIGKVSRCSNVFIE